MNRFAILLLICAGCVPVVRPPGPGPGPQPVIKSLEVVTHDACIDYARRLADLYEAEAAVCEASEEVTGGESHERLINGRDESRKAALSPVNAELHRQIGFDKPDKDRWDQKRAAELYRKIAKGFRNVR